MSATTPDEATPIATGETSKPKPSLWNWLLSRRKPGASKWKLEANNPPKEDEPPTDAHSVLKAARGHKPYFDRFVSDWQNILEENRLLRLTSLVSASVTIICLGILLTQGDRTRTIIMPLSVSGPDVYITGNEPSDGYLQAIAREVVSSIGTFTGSSAQSQFDRLLTHVHPSAYEELRTEWSSLAKDMLAYREVTFATYIRPEEGMKLRAEVLVVPTQRVRFIGATRTTETGYSEIGYLIENGRFWITSYNFLPKGAQRVSTASE